MVPVCDWLSAMQPIEIAQPLDAQQTQDVLGITEYGWAYTGWAFCSLPHRNIPEVGGRPASWRKEVGPVTLSVNPGFIDFQNGQEVEKGVPFGAYARLVLLYLQTVALKTGNREVQIGHNFREFLSRIGVSDSGRARELVWEQLLRIAACTLRFTWRRHEDEPSEFIKSQIVEGGSLSHRFSDTRQGKLWNDKVILDEKFVEALARSAIPLNEAIIKQLSSQSLALDLYVWLAFRLRGLLEPKQLSWVALHSQFGGEYSRVRDFKRAVVKPLDMVTSAVPQARVDIAEKGVILYPIQYKSS